MSSWNDVLVSIQQAGSASPIDTARRKAVGELALYRDRNVICYYSGFLQGSSSLEASINDNDMNGLMNAVHGLDRDKGLDLILHTPGGDLAATEAIVSYLKDCFHGDVVAIVPQMAMSAGTMIACACREIVMGRQSSLGPTDPQLGGVAAGGVVEEFQQAVQEVDRDPSSAAMWAQIIGKYHPTFLGDCKKALDLSQELVGNWLKDGMFSGKTDSDEKAKRVVSVLCDHSASAMHNRHYSYQKLREIGLNVSLLEYDNDLQDKVLTVHHAFMITFQQTGADKVIENSGGKSWIVTSKTR